MPPLGWLGIVRLGFVQMALGAIVVLTTSTLNRVMVVELALPAMLPGALVGLHYALQVLRPRLGYGSDQGGRRTPWIVGGMALLAAGGATASLATAWMADALVPASCLRSLPSPPSASASARRVPRCSCCWPSAWPKKGGPPQRRSCG